MNDQLIEKLVKYFNGSNVALHSIGLQMPSRADMSRDFFQMRSALGIDGYRDDDEARDLIKAALERKQ